ncbi:hypothetical protein PYX08_20325 [Citrobacter freundii]|uniref:hypothetical protein n=1 Tax=Citrobacter freundii complex TaxID=1344959 RepID=UPI000CDC54EB|nr:MULTISPECIES: hypothetical protein [unclassified Citrobacter freundii complex]AUZ69095.1 hypothetical protein C2U41_06795 [Citrobacter freundii complex sp. CFNIH4]MDE5192651.1 hypothetical protein [Citrobacter freundii]POU10201.1 hypothetical protein C3368_17795 [Citrobacter freundii complex sp. CFNIH7]POU11822.1 hypothetical protein C3381_18975 [Citrobacter freundii complex sp. CFNIH6]
MTLEERVEALEKSILRMRQANNEINCAIDELSASVRQQLRVNDEGLQERDDKVILEDGGVTVHLKGGGVIVIKSLSASASESDKLRQAMEQAANAGAAAAIKRIHKDFLSRGPLRRSIG